MGNRWDWLGRERRFDSKIFRPAVESWHRVLLAALPSTWIRAIVCKCTDDVDKKIDRESKYLEIYVIAVTVVLLLGLIVYAMEPPVCIRSFVKWAMLLLAVFRLLEILSQTVEVILRGVKVCAEAAVATVTMYVAQVVLIFAFFSYLVGDGFSDGTVGPKGFGDHIYLGWSVVTLGTPYPITSGSAKLVVGLARATSVVVFSLLLTYAFGLATREPRTCDGNNTDKIDNGDVTCGDKGAAAVGGVGKTEPPSSATEADPADGRGEEKRGE